MGKEQLVAGGGPLRTSVVGSMSSKEGWKLATGIFKTEFVLQILVYGERYWDESEPGGAWGERKAEVSGKRNRLEELVPYLPRTAWPTAHSSFHHCSLSMRWVLTTLKPGKLTQCDTQGQKGTSSLWHALGSKVVATASTGHGQMQR